MNETVCEYGRNLIDLCKKADMRILNGRVLGDLQGSFTCHHYNGSSCVANGIVDSDIFDYVKYFKVIPHLDLISDHCLLSLLLQADYTIFEGVHACEQNDNLYSVQSKYIWGDMSDYAFRCALNSNKVIGKISKFDECDIIYEGNIDGHLMSYSSAADMSLKKVVSMSHKNTAKCNGRASSSSYGKS